MRHVGIVAGELSGDLLGAGLMRALKARHPNIRFEGVGGPAMIDQGLHSLYPLDALSVMGLVEVLHHLPRLLGIRRGLHRQFRESRPDAFIGIDAPDFNLGLERRLRQAGIPTVHYVSPSVWAWRQGRVKGIARSVDLMLALLPFEVQFYQEHGVPVEFVGHPAADRFPMETDTAAYRERLGIPAERTVVALLPGSRRGEVERLGPVFAETAAQLREARPQLELVAPMATDVIRARFEQHLQAANVDGCRLVSADSESVMGAADAVLTASGTATLEAMLLKRPMVVAYRVAPATAWLVRRLGLIKTRRFSLPNLLARESLVPEYIQEGARPDRLADAILQLLDQPEKAEALRRRFRELHQDIRRNASERAAAAVERLVGS